MINKNQFEKSIIYLRDNMSSFIYRAYNEFVTCLDELSTIYTNSASSGVAYTFNENCKNMLGSHNVSFTGTYFSTLPNKIGFKKLSKICRNISIEQFEKAESPEEYFYSVNSTDIYAPVNSIKGFISPNTNSCCNKPFIVKFEIDAYSRYSNRCNNSCIRFEGINGDVTILDSLCSSCNIDIATLFDDIFKQLAILSGASELFNSSDNKESESKPTGIEKLNELVTLARDKSISEKIIDRLLAKAIPTVLATYLVFASKLYGTKNDVYTWAYTSFVKNSVSTIDKAYYPTRAPVTMASGHGTIGQGHGIATDKYSDPVMTEIEVENAGMDDTYLQAQTRKLIYRSIRLQYSTWSSIITDILSTEKLPEVPTETNEWSALISISNESSYSHILRFSRKILAAYLAAKYRTYNTSIQISDNNNMYQSVTAGNKVVSAIKDETAVSYLKELAKSTDKTTMLFVEANNIYLTIIKADKVSADLLAKLFLQTSYLLMMDKIHTSIGSSLDEIDNSTGKSKVAMYEEIYYGVANNIADEIKTYAGNISEYCSVNSHITDNMREVFKNVGTFYTPFIVSEDLSNILFGSDKVPCVDMRFIPESLTKLENEYFSFNTCVCNHIGIPINTDFAKLINGYSFENKYQDRYTTSNEEIFPKNKVIVDSINTLHSKKTYLFKSLESVDNKIEELDMMLNLSSEAADGMANNSCYSALGDICSGVNSIEIKSEEPAVEDKFTVTDGIIGTTVDADNMIMKPDSTTPEDQLRYTSSEAAHAMSERETEKNIIDNIDNKFGFLFNKYILGIK